MSYALIQAERRVLPVERACRSLKVSVSGYYAWQKRQGPAQTASDEAQWVAQITSVFEESRGTYGSPRVTAALRQRGHITTREGDMQKWEYCEVIILDAEPVVLFYKADHVEQIDIISDEEVGASESARRHIAQLGLEGWEMTSSFSSGDAISIWFKRPLQE